MRCGGITISNRRVTARSAALVAAWGGVAAITFLSLYTFRNLTIDDAFIGWRHGANLVEHGRFAFNPVGPQVDAATSPLFGILAALPTLIGIDVVLFFKALTLITIGVGVATIALWPSTRWSVKLVVILLAVGGPVQAVHLWSGLETGAFVLCAAVVCACGLEPGRCPPIVFGTLGALLVTLRFEGFLILAPALWCYAAGRGADPGGGALSWAGVRPLTRRIISMPAAWLPPVAVAAVICLLRYLSTGSPLPNTFATKVGAGLSLGRLLENGRSYFAIGLLVMLVTLVVPVSLRRPFAIIALFVGVAGFLLYVPAHLTMNYVIRFPYQLLWPLVLAGVLSMRKVGIREAAIGLAVFGLLAAVSLSAKDALYWVDYYPRMTDAMLPLGRALEANSGEGRRLYIGDIGQVSFVSGWEVTDTQFLGTPASIGRTGVAQQIRSDRRGVLALYADQPAAAAGEGREQGLGAADQDLVAAAKAAGYVHVTSVSWRPDYWFQIWVSAELESDQALWDALAEVGASSAQANDRERSILGDITNWFWFT